MKDNKQTSSQLNKIIAGFSYQQIKDKFVRKEFSDFDYLEVELTTSQMIWNIVISLILNIGLALFIVANNLNDNWNRYRY